MGAYSDVMVILQKISIKWLIKHTKHYTAGTKVLEIKSAH